MNRVPVSLRWLAAALLVATQSAVAATMTDAFALYDKGDYIKAAETVRSLSPIPPQGLGMLCELAIRKLVVTDKQKDLQACKDAVEAKDPHGLVFYARAMFYGNPWLGIERNEKAGLGYLAQATLAGYQVASADLCEVYFKKNNFTQASPYCKVSASARVPKALFYLAVMNLEGKGAVQDFAKGRKFAVLSASFNHAPAYDLLGDISRDGKFGSAKDLVVSYAWYVLATAAAPDWAEPKKERDELKLSKDQIEAAQKMAEEWKYSQPPKWWELYPK